MCNNCYADFYFCNFSEKVLIMSKRTKSKLRDFKIFLSKEVFSGRYVVRNILITTIIVTLLATTVGTAVLTAQSKGTEVEVEKPIPQSYTINSLDTDVISMDSINFLLAQLDANSEAGVEANETIVVSGANTTNGKVIDNDVFVRAEASYMGEVVATAYLDEEYVVDKSKSNEEWICIVLDDGSLGYINSMFISLEEEEVEETPEAEGDVIEVTGQVTQTETETSQAEKPVQGTGTTEKVDDTPNPPQSSGAVVETPSQNTTESTEEPSTEDVTTEAPATTEQESSSDKPYREDTLVNGGVPVTTTYRSAITLSEEDINLLATIVTLESGGESYDGQLAVANVIINRLQTGYWGDTVADVVYAPYQFSCVSSPMLDYYLANGAQESARQATLEALSGVNNIGNYMCFRATYVTDLENYSVYSIIGNHVFH